VHGHESDSNGAVQVGGYGGYCQIQRPGRTSSQDNRSSGQLSAGCSAHAFVADGAPTFGQRQIHADWEWPKQTQDNMTQLSNSCSAHAIVPTFWEGGKHCQYVRRKAEQECVRIHDGRAHSLWNLNCCTHEERTTRYQKEARVMRHASPQAHPWQTAAAEPHPRTLTLTLHLHPILSHTTL